MNSKISSQKSLEKNKPLIYERSEVNSFDKILNILLTTINGRYVT